MEEDVKKETILNLLDEVIQDLRDMEVKNANAKLTHGSWFTLREKVRAIEKEVKEY